MSSARLAAAYYEREKYVLSIENTHVFVQRINQFSVVEQHEPPSLPSLKHKN